MREYSNRNEGQMIFKNIFEYHTKGLLNDSEFCELMDLIYSIRWDNDNYKPTNASEKVQMIWQGISPTFKKSKSNAEYYDRKQVEKGKEPKCKQDYDSGEIDNKNYQLLAAELNGRKIMKTDIDKIIEKNESIKKCIERNKINRSTVEAVFNDYWNLNNQ